MLRFIKRIRQTGIFSQMDAELVKRVRLSNDITLTILFFIVPYIFIFYFLGYEMLGLLLIPVGLLFLPVFYLNYFSRTLASRVWLVVGMNLLLGTYAILLGKEAGIHYLYFTFVGIPFLIFSITQITQISLSLILPAAGFYLVQFALPGGMIETNPSAHSTIYVCMVTLTIIWTVINYAYLSLAGREKERLLEQKERKFRTLINHAPDAMVLCGRDGRIQMVNTRFQEWFGFKAFDLFGKRFSFMVAEGQPFADYDHFITYCNAAAHNLTPQMAEQLLKRADGSLFPAELSIAGLETDSGTIIAMSIRDTTDRKLLEALKIQAAESETRNKELEQFAYIVSHDLKAPVQNIMTLTDIINRDRDNIKQTQQVLEMISRSAARMHSLIHDLLSYASGEQQEASIVDCGALVNEIQHDLSSIISDKRAEVRVGKLPQVTAKPTSLRLLFQNLISNGLKFQKDDSKPLIEISSTQENGHWKFAVSDNGIGIDKKDTTRIFEVFERLYSKDEYEGSGLGLAHCKKIVDQHGGSIWVESEANKGSTFFFTLPFPV